MPKEEFSPVRTGEAWTATWPGRSITHANKQELTRTHWKAGI